MAATPGFFTEAMRGPNDSADHAEGRDIVAVGVLVVQTGDGLLRGVGRVVLAEEGAVLRGRRTEIVDGLDTVVPVRALPLDALALVQHDRVVAVLLEGRLVEALELVEYLAAGAVGVHAPGVELVPPEV